MSCDMEHIARWLHREGKPGFAEAVRQMARDYRAGKSERAALRHLIELLDGELAEIEDIAHGNVGMMVTRTRRLLIDATMGGGSHEC